MTKSPQYGILSGQIDLTNTNIMARKKNQISGPSITEQKKWEAENALSILRRAEEIRANKSLMNRVAQMAKKEVAAVSKFAKK